MKKTNMYPLSVKQWNPNESYIGGLLDGEGSVLVIATHEKRLQKMRLRPYVKITQKRYYA
jgi:hypothetical protein